MDEFSVVLKARNLVAEVNPTVIPVSVDAYVERVSAVLRLRTDLDDDEPGWSFENNGKHFICINANDRQERQRFTTCHEVAHKVLELPSDHKGLPCWSYCKRPLSEIFCDVFAAELLLPYRLFKPLAGKVDIGLAGIDDLAERFVASTMATGSRFAMVINAPCAFVLSENGVVRYAARSKTLRESNVWISPRTPLPPGSVSERIYTGGECDGPEEVEADVWFSDWDRGGTLLEEARHLKTWNQTLSLLWFEDEELPLPKRDDIDVREELGLQELDGILPWPGKKSRRR